MIGIEQVGAGFTNQWKIAFMNWDLHISKLQAGESVSFRPKGNSMSGKIESGQLVTVEPIVEALPGDIVLCKVKGNIYVHLVKAVGDKGYLIANNKGYENGWTKTIYGKVTKVED